MIESLTDKHYNIPEKFIVMNLPMGQGKTERTANYLRDSKTSFIFMSPNIALGSGTISRLREKGIKIRSYNEFNSREKKLGILNKQKYLIPSLRL